MNPLFEFSDQETLRPADKNPDPAKTRPGPTGSVSLTKPRFKNENRTGPRFIQPPTFQPGRQTPPISRPVNFKPEPELTTLIRIDRSQALKTAPVDRPPVDQPDQSRLKEATPTTLKPAKPPEPVRTGPEPELTTLIAIDRSNQNRPQAKPAPVGPANSQPDQKTRTQSPRPVAAKNRIKAAGATFKADRPEPQLSTLVEISHSQPGSVQTVSQSVPATNQPPVSQTPKPKARPGPDPVTAKAHQPGPRPAPAIMKSPRPVSPAPKAISQAPDWQQLPDPVAPGSTIGAVVQQKRAPKTSQTSTDPSRPVQSSPAAVSRAGQTDQPKPATPAVDNPKPVTGPIPGPKNQTTQSVLSANPLTELAAADDPVGSLSDQLAEADRNPKTVPAGQVETGVATMAAAGVPGAGSLAIDSLDKLLSIRPMEVSQADQPVDPPKSKYGLTTIRNRPKVIKPLVDHKTAQLKPLRSPGAGLLLPVTSTGTADPDLATLEAADGQTDSDYPIGLPVNQKQLSRFRLNLITLIMLAGAILTGWLLWPWLSGFFIGLVPDDDRQLESILQNSLTSPIVAYEAGIEVDFLNSRLSKNESTITSSVYLNRPADRPGYSQVSQSHLDYQSLTDDNNQAAPADKIELDVELTRVNQIESGLDFVSLNKFRINQTQTSPPAETVKIDTRAGQSLRGAADKDELATMVAELTEIHSPDYYNWILPMANLTDSDQVNQVVDYIINEQIYQLFDCQEVVETDDQIICKVNVSISRLGGLYEKIYREILQLPEAELAQFLDRINTGFQFLPRRFQIIIDTANNRPVQIKASLPDRNHPNALNQLTIDYSQPGPDQSPVQVPATGLAIEEWVKLINNFQGQTAFGAGG